MICELDCLPCLIRQTLEVTRLSTDDPILQRSLIMDAMRILSDMKPDATSPAITRDVHRMIRQRTGLADPYRTMKDSHIEKALALAPVVRAWINSQPDPLLAAIKASAAGNLIDAAVYSEIDVEQAVMSELERPFYRCDLAPFKAALQTARTVLILGDNAGETVFDRLLAEQLQDHSLHYAVKSQPIINDAVRSDAKASGLAAVASLVESGCDTPGTLLEEANDAFLDLFERADVVISKGQGNYEGLSTASRDLFFLLTAKCDVIARAFAVPVGSTLFIHQAARP